MRNTAASWLQVFPGGHIAVFTGPDGKEWFAYRGESCGKAQGRLCVDPIPFNDDGSVRPFSPSLAPDRQAQHGEAR